VHFDCGKFITEPFLVRLDFFSNKLLWEEQRNSQFTVVRNAFYCATGERKRDAALLSASILRRMTFVGQIQQHSSSRHRRRERTRRA